MINYKFIWAYSKVVLWTYDCECVSSKEEQILSGGLESRVQFVECKDQAVHVFLTSVWWLCITIFMKRRIGPKWCVITNTREVLRDVGYWAHYTKGLFFFKIFFLIFGYNQHKNYHNSIKIQEFQGNNQSITKWYHQDSRWRPFCIFSLAKEKKKIIQSPIKYHQ